MRHTPALRNGRAQAPEGGLRRFISTKLPAYLSFARLMHCEKGYIAQLCTPLRVLRVDDDPAQSGNFVSANPLTANATKSVN